MNEDSSRVDTGTEIAALRNQIFMLLVALIVVSGTVSIYLYRQASVANKDLNSLNQVINAWNQNTNSVIGFVNGVVAYGQTHPDFRPVLAKYGISPLPNAPAAAAPAAAPGAAPKK